MGYPIFTLFALRTVQPINLLCYTFVHIERGVPKIAYVSMSFMPGLHPSTNRRAESVAAPGRQMSLLRAGMHAAGTADGLSAPVPNNVHSPFSVSHWHPRRSSSCTPFMHAMARRISCPIITHMHRTMNEPPMFYHFPRKYENNMVTYVLAEESPVEAPAELEGLDRGHTTGQLTEHVGRDVRAAEHQGLQVQAAREAQARLVLCQGRHEGTRYTNISIVVESYYPMC